ncbi:unnamed protein product, partial [Closterium sp. NIES-64]
MWRLRVATGDSPFLTSVSDFPGRQTWEFDPAAGTEEERQEVERLREEFTRNRQERKHSSDALMRNPPFTAPDEAAGDAVCLTSFLPAPALLFPPLCRPSQLTGGKPPANQLPPVRVAEEPVSTATAVDEATVEVTLRRAVRFYETIQAEDGHWAGDYGGPPLPHAGCWQQSSQTCSSWQQSSHRKPVPAGSRARIANLFQLAAELANLFQLAAELASQTCSSWQQSSHRKPVPAGSRARIANLFQLAAELASQTCSSWQQTSHRKPVPAGSRARIANLFQLAAELASQTCSSWRATIERAGPLNKRNRAFPSQVLLPCATPLPSQPPFDRAACLSRPGAVSRAQESSLHCSALKGSFFLFPFSPLLYYTSQLITLHVTGALDQVLTAEHKREMVRYLYNHQNPDGGWGLHIEGHSTMFGSTLNYVSLRILGEHPASPHTNPDGGWGLHIEGHSTMFGSTLSYVSLRILGEHPANPAMTACREWILSHGSATASTSWGKFWLC